MGFLDKIFKQKKKQGVKVEGFPVRVSTDDKSRPVLQRQRMRAERLKIAIKNAARDNQQETSRYITMKDELAILELRIKQHKQNVRGA